MIGEADYIVHFRTHPDLADSRMPFIEKPKHHFPRTHNDELWNKFRDEQWTFCPASFEGASGREWEPRRILPITSKNLLHSGGCAKTFQITVDQDCNEIRNSSVGIKPQVYAMLLGLTNKPATINQSSDDQRSNEFVLKSYRRGTYNEAQYRKEIQAFNPFRDRTTEYADRSSLIDFCGSYSFEKSDTFNILLEHAGGGTLEDMFQKEEPPKNPLHIKKFWYKLFEVVQALHMIHDVKEFHASGLGHLKGYQTLDTSLKAHIR